MHPRLPLIGLILLAPAILQQASDAIDILFAPLVIAGSGQPDHPITQVTGRHGRTELRFEHIPGRVGFEHLAFRGFDLELGILSIAIHFEVDAADADRAADLHFCTSRALLPIE